MKISSLTRSFFPVAAFAAFAAGLSPALVPSLFAAPSLAPQTASEAKAPLVAESRIRAATVYPDRAVVSRVAKVRVAAGTSEIVFSALPAELVDESVQVAARGAVTASLLDITVRSAFLAAEPDARLRAAAEKIVELRRRDAMLNDESELVGSQRTLVGTIEQAYLVPGKSASGAAAAARPSLEDYEKFLGFSAAQRSRIEKEARELELRRAALADEMAAAQKQFAALRDGQAASRMEKTVTVRLAAPVGGELEVTLGYAVPGASWTPAYDARLRSAERTVQLDAFGVVRNRTGEDWREIELTLSTARPGLGGAAPEIAPWVVDAAGWGGGSSSSFWGFQKKPKRPDPSATVIGQQGVLNPNEAGVFGDIVDPGSDLSAGLSVDSLLAGAASVTPPPAPELEDAKLLAAENEVSATSASFRIAVPVTVASDNAPQRVPLGASVLAAELGYESAPKLQEAVYLAASVKNTGETPFLAGSVNAFLDETFVATSRLGTTMPGEVFTLHLGADEGISIKRKVVSRFTEAAGIASRGRRTSYEILTTVTNHKRTAERIVVRDAAPVSRDEKVVVKLAAPAERELLKLEDAAERPGRPGIARDAEGRLAWCLDLKPGEKRELPLRFSIEHPAELPVTGVE